MYGIFKLIRNDFINLNIWYFGLIRNDYVGVGNYQKNSENL